MHGGKDGQNGTAEDVHQAPVLRAAADIDDHHPVIGQVVAHDLKKLLGGEVPGDVGRAVGIHADDLVAVGVVLQRPAAVLNGHVQVVHGHAEVLAAYLDDFGVDFDAFHLNVGEDQIGLAGGGAGCQPDNCQAADVLARDRGGIEKWRHQHLLPWAVVEIIGGVVLRMDALPVIEPQIARFTDLQHLDVVVGRVGLENHAGGGFVGSAHAVKRQNHQYDGHPQPGEDFSPTRGQPQAGQGYDQQDSGDDQEGAVGANPGNEDQDRQEGADEGAESRDGVDAARDAAGLA